MRRLLVLVVVLLAFIARGRSADVNPVIYWNQAAIDATRLSRNPPPIAADHYATFHVAIFDAINGISHQYQNWLVKDAAPAGADVDAAIASAAYTVMMARWGDAANPHNLDVEYQNALAKIPDGQAKTDGVAWGKHVAEAVLAARANSGFNKPIPGKYSSNDVGKWRETPPGFRPPTMPFWGNVIPFVMTSPSQFRAPPPFALESQETADELAYVAKVGPRDGAERSEYETMSTPFWSDDLGTSTPPGHWNIVAEDLAVRKNLSVIETARLFALLNMAEDDAGISCWDTKFFYRMWRPETALRELDAKTNAHITPVPEFIPNMPSPSFPSYTSGHSTFSAAATRILELYFGSDDIEFTVKSDGLPGAVRSYKSFSEARREVGMSRVWGGIHTMSDNIEGQKAGLKIADWVFTHALQPAGAVASAAPVNTHS